MKPLEGNYNCTCGQTFRWKCIKLENNEAVFSRINNLSNHVIKVDEIQDRYIIELECPYCGKRNFIEKQSDC